MNVGIIGIGSAVPKDSYTNDEFAMMTGLATDDVWITKRTGIKTRRLARSNEKTSDYALAASENAIACAMRNDQSFSRNKIGVIVLATSTPDYECPSTASAVQDLLGLACFALDVKAGCSGFVAALQVAKAYVASGEYEYALVVGADLLSRISNYYDRGSSPLFADAAGAVIVGPVSEGGGIGGFVAGSDGSKRDKLFIPHVGDTQSWADADIPPCDGTLLMIGKAVFTFAISIMPKVIAGVAAKAKIRLQAVDWFFAHQANARIIEAAAKALGLPMDKFYVNVDRYGNTSAASIPLALDEAYRAGKLATGMKLILVAFGAGLTWAGCFMEWSLKRIAPTGNG